MVESSSAAGFSSTTRFGMTTNPDAVWPRRTTTRTLVRERDVGGFAAGALAADPVPPWVGTHGETEELRHIFQHDRTARDWRKGTSGATL